MHFLTTAEVEKLADSFRRPEHRLLILFAAYTGLRAGEIGALRVKNLNLGGDPSVRVEEAVSDVNGKLITGTPKSDASRRTVPLPAFLVAELRSYLTTIDPNAYVFTAAKGGQLRHNNFMKRFWRRAVAAADLPPTLRFHDLRHTFASLMIAEGAHPKELQEQMGHSTVMITLDRYGHVFPQRRSELAAKLDVRRSEAIGRTPEPTAEVVSLR